MAKLSCFDVADYFLSKVDEEAGDVISNLMLQKMVYYAQGFSLAVYDKPLFEEDLIAWQHGPVCVPLYQKFQNGDCASGIPAPISLNLEKFSQSDKELLDEVYAVYGQFSAWKLRNMTLGEAPLKETPVNGIISLRVMKSFFKERLR